MKDSDKLDKDSIILLEQIRTIDKQRLKQYIGLMPDHIMARVETDDMRSNTLMPRENSSLFIVGNWKNRQDAARKTR